MRKVLYIFGQLRDDDVEWLASAGSARHWARGVDVIRQGTDAGKLFIVLGGELQVVGASGAELARIGVGEVVGEMSFVEARPPSASVRTLSESMLFEIPRDALSQKLDQDAPFAARFYRALAVFLSDRLRAASSGKADSDDDELDPNILDNLSQAGARFDRLVQRVHRSSLVP